MRGLASLVSSSLSLGLMVWGRFHPPEASAFHPRGGVCLLACESRVGKGQRPGPRVLTPGRGLHLPFRSQVWGAHPPPQACFAHRRSPLDRWDRYGLCTSVQGPEDSGEVTTAVLFEAP